MARTTSPRASLPWTRTATSTGTPTSPTRRQPGQLPVHQRKVRPSGRPDRHHHGRVDRPLGDTPMAQGVTAIAGLVGSLTHTFEAYFFYGVIYVPAGTSSITMRIDMECSGIIETMAFLSLLVFYPVYSRYEKVAVGILGTAILLVSNALRIVIICEIVHFFGPDAFALAHTYISHLTNTRPSRTTHGCSSRRQKPSWLFSQAQPCVIRPTRRPQRTRVESPARNLLQVVEASDRRASCASGARYPREPRSRRTLCESSASSSCDSWSRCSSLSRYRARLSLRRASMSSLQ